MFTAGAGRLVDRSRKAHAWTWCSLDGTRHAANLKDPAKYEVARFAELILGLDPDSVFRITEILKGDNEMTIPELEARAAELRAERPVGRTAPLMALHRKFSLPAACLVLRRDRPGARPPAGARRQAGRLRARDRAWSSSYYIIEYQGRQMAKGQLLPPWLAVWAPNLVLGTAGVALLLWRARSADKPLRLTIPERWQFWKPRSAAAAAGSQRTPAAGGATRRPVGGGDPAAAPQPAVLPAARRLRLAPGAEGLGADVHRPARDLLHLDVHRHVRQAVQGPDDGGDAGQFFYYQTPQFVFFIIPLTILIAVMVTIGILTKNSEIVVMQACGISIYRVAVPLVALGRGRQRDDVPLQDRVLPYSNRRASELHHIIRGGTPRTFDVVNRKWLVARDGSIYNYTFYDQRRHELNGLSILEFDRKGGNVARRVYVGNATLRCRARSRCGGRTTAGCASSPRVPT